MWHGWNGKVLRVDLSRGKIVEKELRKDMAYRYIGGRGFNSHTLMMELPFGIDPLSPDNIIAIAPGALTGTPMPMSSRVEISTLSPYSGILGDGSAGGQFPHFLKLAGVDQIVVYGRASKPVYLWIENGVAELKDASELWGLDVWETEEWLKEMHGKDVRVAAIGPAGENLVRFASTMTDRHSSAARGSGAVFGSKNMKAIAVRGELKVELADEDKFMELVKDELQFFKSNRFQSRVVRNYGTHIGMVYWYPAYRYFQKYLNPDEVSKDLLPPSWKRYETGRYACYLCPVACKNRYEIDGEENAGLEFEAIQCLGTNSGIEDSKAIAKMANMADKYGMDVIALGNTIAYVKELYHRGIIDRSKTDGLDLSWENAESQIELIEKITRREGFGNLVAEGLYNIARHLGGKAVDYCYHVKGLSRGVHPAGIFSLAHATSTRGADHLRGRTWAYGENDGTLFKEWVEEGLIPDVNTDPVATMTLCERVTTMSDAIGRCKGAVTSWVAAVPLVWKYPIWGGIARYLSYATGHHFKERDVAEAAERIYITERSFNVTRGITTAHDTIPLNPDMPADRRREEEEKHRALLRKYYEIHGYDENGIPTRERLEKLSAEDVAERLFSEYPYEPWNGPKLWNLRDYPHN